MNGLLQGPQKEGRSSTWAKVSVIFKFFGIALAIAIFIAIIMSFFKMGMVFWVYDRVFSWVTARLGADYYLAQFISLSLTAIFSAMYPYLLWSFFVGRYRIPTTIAVVAGSGIMCILVYTAGSEVFFDRSTGQPLKWYADTPDGRTYSNTPGYDKKFGIQLRPFTADVAQREGRANKKKNDSGRSDLANPQGVNHAGLPSRELPQREPVDSPVQMTDDKSFVEVYLRDSGSRDVGRILSYYANNVDYYSKGWVSKEFIRKDKESYFRKWLSVDYTLDGDVEMQETPVQNEKLVRFVYNFTVKSASKTVKGRADNFWRIRHENGRIFIVGENQKVLGREVF